MIRWRRPIVLVGKPTVIVDFEHDDGRFFVAIENIGSRPAHCVTTTFAPSFTGVGGTRDIPSLSLFSDLGFLPPGKRIRAFVDTAAAYFDRGEPTTIRTEVSFRDAEGRTFETQATHDLGIYRDLPTARAR